MNDLLNAIEQLRSNIGKFGRHWTAVATVALLAGITVIPGDLHAAGRARFWVDFEDVKLVQVVYTGSATRILQLVARSSDPATTTSVIWPADASIPFPATLKNLNLRFIGSQNDPDESQRVIDVCMRTAQLAQADPARYKLRINVDIQDADDFFSVSATSYQVDIKGSYTLTCGLEAA